MDLIAHQSAYGYFIWGYRRGYNYKSNSIVLSKYNRLYCYIDSAPGHNFHNLELKLFMPGLHDSLRPTADIDEK